MPDYTFNIESDDPELAAIELCHIALTKAFRVDEGARARIARYIGERYSEPGGSRS